jgi:ATP-dependent Clp protease ATP-binding subunit ClpA
VLKQADKLRVDGGDAYLGVHHLLLALAQDLKVAKVFKEQGLTLSKVKAVVQALRKGRRTENRAEAEGQFDNLKVREGVVMGLVC